MLQLTCPEPDPRGGRSACGGVSCPGVKYPAGNIPPCREGLFSPGFVQRQPYRPAAQARGAHGGKPFPCSSFGLLWTAQLTPVAPRRNLRFGARFPSVQQVERTTDFRAASRKSVDRTQATSSLGCRATAINESIRAGYGNLVQLAASGAYLARRLGPDSTMTRLTEASREAQGDADCGSPLNTLACLRYQSADNPLTEGTGAARQRVLVGDC